MPEISEGKSQVLAGVLAFVALAVAGGAGFFAITEGLGFSLAFILALVAGFALEFYSSSISGAGYFSLASPVWLFMVTAPAATESPARALIGFTSAIALTGISALGRLVAPDKPLGTRLAGYAANVLRVASVGGTVFAIRQSLPGSNFLVAAVGAGFLAWLFFDWVFINFLFAHCEDSETQQTWSDVATPQHRLLLALPSLACSLGGVATDGSQEAVAIGALALLSLPFAGELSYWLDGIMVRDQEELERQLRIAQHQAKTQRESIDKTSAQTKRLQEELASVNEMAQSLGSTNRLEDILGIVQSMVRRLRIPFQSFVIFLRRSSDESNKDNPERDLYPAFIETPAPYRSTLGMRHLLQLEEPLTHEVLNDRRPRIKTDYPAKMEGRIFKEERSVLCTPLIVGDKTLGVFYVGSPAANTHNEEHLKALKMLADFAAPSINNALQFDDKEQDLDNVKKALATVEAKRRQLEGLQKMGQKMGASLKAHTTLSVVANSIKSMIENAQSVILFTHDPEAQDGHALKTEFSETPYTDYVRNLALRDDEGILGKAISSASTILFQDTKMYDVQNLLGSEHSVVVAPLFGGSEDTNDGQQAEGSQSNLLGCLYVGAAKEGGLTEEHRGIIETISYQTAMALKNARLYEQTQKMALSDGLTGLYTHRLFQEKLEEEILYAERTKQPVVLVMVDADNFKTYNDTLGHPAGDALLKEIASLLKDKVRASDIVSRYGGDEFALLLKNTRKEDAVTMCERIREAFQLRFGGNQVQVTSSIGLACYPEDADSKKDLAQAADDALYVSKRGGRNRVSASKDLATRRREGPMVQEIIKRPAEIAAEKAAALKAAQLKP